jgi:hypothetical protein
MTLFPNISGGDGQGKTLFEYMLQLGILLINLF